MRYASLRFGEPIIVVDTALAISLAASPFDLFPNIHFARAAYVKSS